MKITINIDDQTKGILNVDVSNDEKGILGKPYVADNKETRQYLSGKISPKLKVSFTTNCHHESTEYDLLVMDEIMSFDDIRRLIPLDNSDFYYVLNLLENDKNYKRDFDNIVDKILIKESKDKIYELIFFNKNYSLILEVKLQNENIYDLSNNVIEPTSFANQLTHESSNLWNIIVKSN